MSFQTFDAQQLLARAGWPLAIAPQTTDGALAAALPAGFAYPTFPPTPGFAYTPYVYNPYAVPPTTATPTAAPLSLNLPTIPKTLFVGKEIYPFYAYKGGNLASSITSELLEQVFAQFGTVTQVNYKKTNHYAFISYSSPKEATWAKANTNGLALEGRVMRVSWGKEGQTK
jgi:hypothetical protein